jgi:hypothetical protein
MDQLRTATCVKGTLGNVAVSTSDTKLRLQFASFNSNYEPTQTFYNYFLTHLLPEKVVFFLSRLMQLFPNMHRTKCVFIAHKLSRGYHSSSCILTICHLSTSFGINLAECISYSHGKINEIIKIKIDCATVKLITTGF